MTARAAAAVLMTLAALAGCSDGADPAAAPSPSKAGAQAPAGGGAGVEVDTRELRAARRGAGIPPCSSRVGGSADARSTDAGSTDATPTAGGLPDLTLPCLGGGPEVDLGVLRGPLVVNLWASYCLPCRDELPYFAKLDDAGVDVLGVDFEEPQPDRALALAADTGVGYPSVADVDGALKAPLRVSALPTTLLVDEDGAVAARLVQTFDSYDELAAVEQHLGVRP